MIKTMTELNKHNYINIPNIDYVILKPDKETLTIPYRKNLKKMELDVTDFKNTFKSKFYKINNYFINFNNVLIVNFDKVEFNKDVDSDNHKLMKLIFKDNVLDITITNKQFIDTSIMLKKS